LVLIARHGHWITELKSPTPHDLQAVEWILPLPGNRHRGRLSQFFELAGLAPPVATIECSTTAFLKTVVRQTDYVGIVARIALHPEHDIIDRELTTIEIDSPSMIRPVGLVWRASQVLTPAIRLAMRAIEDGCRKRS
jgi:DNA-binding transcriptional LysR family regulator